MLLHYFTKPLTKNGNAFSCPRYTDRSKFCSLRHFCLLISFLILYSQPTKSLVKAFYQTFIAKLSQIQQLNFIFSPFLSVRSGLIFCWGCHRAKIRCRLRLWSHLVLSILLYSHRLLVKLIFLVVVGQRFLFSFQSTGGHSQQLEASCNFLLHGSSQHGCLISFRPAGVHLSDFLFCNQPEKTLFVKCSPD